MDLQPITGIHHITAIASDPQHNLDFYTQVLGLRLVKLTVNFDAPETYHFYFGNATGQPGSILTFFPWPESRQSKQGARQASHVAFSIPLYSVDYWVNRLNEQGVNASPVLERFSEQVIQFTDPDGLQLELVTSPFTGETPAWEASPVPAQYGLRGFHGVTLMEEDFEPTARLLTEIFGFQQTQEAENHARFEAPSAEPGHTIDLVSLPAAPIGRMGHGAVHHVAWRAADDAAQLAWRERLVAAGLDVTPVLDRQYFHSIYFREPGGVLFEIATDPPGFAIDESQGCLGTNLKLPSWLEPHRQEIEQSLPALRLPQPCNEMV